MNPSSNSPSRVAVYCGSANGTDPAFLTEAEMMKKSETPIEAPNFYMPAAAKPSAK